MPLMSNYPSTLYGALAARAASQPDALALTHEDVTFTYAQLMREVELTSGRLLTVGVQAGDRVILIGNNSCAWVIVYLATMRVGAISVPMNNRLTPLQVSELVTLLDSKIAICDLAHVNMFSAARGVQLYGLGEAAGLGNLLHVAGSDRPLRDADPDSPAVISFTSGTTGVPKGAVLSHSALYVGARVIAESLSLDANDSTIVVAPLFHNTGFNDQVGAMLLSGGRTDILSRYRTKSAIAALRKQSVTFLTAVPSVLRLMMTDEEAEIAFKPARHVLFGGSPMPHAWSSEMLGRWPHLKLWHGYGLTEFTSCCTLLPPELIQNHGDSIGFPPTGVELRLVDENGGDVPAGVAGEIWVAGQTRMLEYWKRPDVTAEKLSGKWLRTGDLGEYRNGLLYHVGRRDDVINRGGEKVLPSYVESILSQRPDVAQCVVFGVPHPILQQRVLAAVEARPGFEFDPVAAQAHLSERLPGYSLPEDIHVVEALPRTASGKIDRRTVALEYLKQNMNHQV